MTPLQPGLLPGPADLLQAWHFAVVVILTCGLGFLAGARRPETALFTGWGVACLVSVGSGCLAGAGLAPVALLLALLGTAGLLLRLRSPVNAGGVALFVLALAAPLLLMLLSLRTTAFDDFSFWAPNLVALCLTGHFPTAAHSLAASFMPGYPRGVALSGYATWLLGPDPSAAGILRLLATGAWWNILLMLAAAAALANNLLARLQAGGDTVTRNAIWALAASAILLQSFLNPGFISKMTLSNMGDGATGSGLAMLTALLFELPAAEKPKPRLIIEMAFTAAAIAFVRQDNLALLFIWGFGVAIGLFFWVGRGRLRRFGWLAVAALPALLTGLIWTRYAALQIPGGAHSLLPIGQWHWADYPATLHAAGRVLLSKGVYTLLALAFSVLFLALLRGQGPSLVAQKLVLTAATLLIFGNAAFILFTYLATSFTQVEVRTAVTFWRFLAQTAPAEMVALACLLPLPFWRRLTRNAKASAALCLVTALLPVALLPTPYTFRTDLRFQTPVFLAVGQSLAATLPRNARLLLLDNSDGSGYAAWIIKFGLQELAGATLPVTLSLAPQLAPRVQASPQAVPEGSYVLVTQSQWRPPYFLNVPMQPWHAYLFQSRHGGLTLLKSWPIPCYGRNTENAIMLPNLRPGSSFAMPRQSF